MSDLLTTEDFIAAADGLRYVHGGFAETDTQIGRASCRERV